MSALNVPDDDKDENCRESDNKKCRKCQQTEKQGQIFSEQRRTRRKSGGPVREFPPQPVGSSEVRNLLLRRELCQPLTTFWTNHQALGRASSGRLQQKSRRRELQETCNPGGLGGGCTLLSNHRPYQAA